MDDLTARLASDLDGTFPELVDVMAGDLYSGLRRLHGDDGEDLAQETLIRAYEALRTYETERIRDLRLRGWLWTIALNLGRNHARAKARRPTPVLLEDRHGVADPEPVDASVWDARLCRLTPVQRKAVVLRHVVGLSYEEIATVTGRPQATVRTDVRRGLTRLRTVIDEEDT